MIHRQIIRIRSILNDNEHAILRADPSGYWLDRTNCKVDAEQFVLLMDQGREKYVIGHPEQAADALEKALRLWRDIKALRDVRDNHMLDEFANYLEMRHLEASELLVDSYLRSQRVHQALQELVRLTTRHPGREPFWARLMLAQALDGSFADASMTFKRIRNILCREYGLDPSPFLCQVHEMILRCPSKVELLSFLTPGYYRTTLCKSVASPP
ncbi:AfsR/SARP family transcriptional regulator [Streptosporangium sp. NPDC051022]|uniref:AfsR/SARP family transcriptional regulator n=1 Tax=Streptosporangium sp. NPDC051022 TaxID=3155752 RepID=UPI0034168A76